MSCFGLARSGFLKHINSMNAASGASVRMPQALPQVPGLVTRSHRSSPCSVQMKTALQQLRKVLGTKEQSWGVHVCVRCVW